MHTPHTSPPAIRSRSYAMMCMHCNVTHAAVIMHDLADNSTRVHIVAVDETMHSMMEEFISQMADPMDFELVGRSLNFEHTYASTEQEVVDAIHAANRANPDDFRQFIVKSCDALGTMIQEVTPGMIPDTNVH